MCVGVSFNNASRHGTNHDFAPLDILVGGDRGLVWQSPGYGSGKEGGGGEKCFAADAWTCKNNQVPLGRPLGSGHLNIGVDRIGRESGVANVDQSRGHSGCFSAEGLDEHVMSEAKHEARPRRGRGVGSTGLSRKGLRAEGWVRGAWSGLCFRGDFSKGHPFLTLFLARHLRYYSRGDEVDGGRGGGREWGGGNRGRHQISRNLGRLVGSHLALFQGAWHRSAKVRGRRVRRVTRCHNSIFIARKGGGEEWVRETGGRRDINGKLSRADCSGMEGFRSDEFQEAVDDLVKAKGFDGVDIRGQCRPKGHGGREERLEGSGEGELRNRAQKHVDVAFIDAMCRDERRDGVRSRRGGNKWVGEGVAITAAFLKRLPSNLRRCEA